MESFELDITKFMENTHMKADQVARSAGMAMYQGVTSGTPVLTGRARANWHPAVNEIDQTADENTQLDGMRATVTFQGAKIGDTLTIANSLPYIEGLEHGNSKQAPNGMVEITIEEVKRKIESGGL